MIANISIQYNHKEFIKTHSEIDTSRSEPSFHENTERLSIKCIPYTIILAKNMASLGKRV